MAFCLFNINLLKALIYWEDFMHKETAVFNSAGTVKLDHAVANLVHEASAFNCSIYLLKGERRANAKSLLGVISLGITDGDELTVQADGEDAEAAVKALINFINNPA
jgi:phosphotransferase system HPr (HPr) family protein